ncbi:Aste57867_18866 [Aphanomyces stellatus]|uniref:Aste57867_18866 protein n=1 Tax=Aphanomyces stellatus TaxID=120398 RepID=A0A485LBF1_9STRA|nr:hypothetical protein As57867_018802 [Aphanomyces stellatus]VFT95600.1 Aste57867_18866 [Aphanomyces stellatus]
MASSQPSRSPPRPEPRTPTHAEITLTFTKKPLGIGLVPSTQLYGQWEVGHVPPDCPDLETGDVLMAVNGDAAVNQMDTPGFRTFMARLACPLTITFRKPHLHGHCDSQRTATALFPQSIEYTQFMRGKTRHGRASAEQWKKSAARDDTTLAAKGRDTKGDIDYTFTSKPLHLAFGPSTRMYGSIEIVNVVSPVHAVTLHPGDVLLKLNGTIAAKWSLEDLESHLHAMDPPFTMTFRNPAIYLRYLREFFEPPVPASTSTSRAMFPTSKEYKGTATDAPPPPIDKHEWQTAHAKLKQNKWLAYFENSVVLKRNHVRVLTAALPIHLQMNEWKLLFSTQEHGFNMTTFYQRTQDKGPTIVAIKDATDQVFGAFTPSSLKHTKNVYGNGRAFVFQHATVYGWSGLDSNFVYGGPNKSIVWGGGTSGLALCLQLDEARGFTQPCVTFDSPELTHPPQFDCWAVEVWGFGGMKL